jgi:hypothetical protein
LVLVISKHKFSSQNHERISELSIFLNVGDKLKKTKTQTLGDIDFRTAQKMEAVCYHEALVVFSIT